MQNGRFDPENDIDLDPSEWTESDKNDQPQINLENLFWDSVGAVIVIGGYLIWRHYSAG